LAPWPKLSHHAWSGCAPTRPNLSVNCLSYLLSIVCFLLLPSCRLLSAVYCLHYYILCLLAASFNLYMLSPRMERVCTNPANLIGLSVSVCVCLCAPTRPNLSVTLASFNLYMLSPVCRLSFVVCWLPSAALCILSAYFFSCFPNCFQYAILTLTGSIIPQP
jgi:hypothetical protein